MSNRRECLTFRKARDFLDLDYREACQSSKDGGFTLSQLLVHYVFARATCVGADQLAVMQEAAMRGTQAGLARRAEMERLAAH